MRKTPLVETVTSIFKEAHRPMSVPELQEKLHEYKINPNKTTLYRMLEKLTQAGDIETLFLDSKTTYYELKTHDHHHFTCEECHRVACINDEKLEKRIQNLTKRLAKEGFSTHQKHFALTGICNHCQ